MGKLTKKNHAKEKTSKVLTSAVSKGKAVSKLTSDESSSVKFKIALTETLQNPYTFKKMKPADIKEFSSFLSKTVGRNLSISKVEQLYLRTDGPNGAKNKETIHDAERITKHFDNGSRDFRIHGYYDDSGYFCVCRIDPHHEYVF